MTSVVAVAVFGAAVWVLLCWRGWRAGLQVADERRQMNKAQYHEQVATLDAALAAGSISVDEADLERGALQQQLLAGSEGGAAQWRGELSAFARLAAVVIPLGLAALAFVWSNGEQHWQQEPEAAAPDVEAMVQGLAARLEQDPDDFQGWVMLGRSYMVLERFGEAAQAWEQANARSPSPDADLLVAEAEALALARDRDLEGRPERLLKQALELNPEHVRGLWYTGLAARSRGDMMAAEDYFKRLSALPELPDELRNVLSDMGFAGVAVADTAPASAYAVNINLSLAEALRGKAAPGQVLFVFARQPNGPPMPLAVQRLAVGELPMQVRLDDSMSMVPGRQMSAESQLEFVARISAAGRAAAEPGDWQGRVVWNNQPEGGTIDLIIDEIVR